VGSQTPIASEHKALLYDARRALLVVPVTERHGYSCEQPPSFHGAKVFAVSGALGGAAAGDGATGTFVLRAAIEHGPNRSDVHAWSGQGGYTCASSACDAAAIRRSLYIGDELYTLSDAEVHATSLVNFSPTWRADLHRREVLATGGRCTVDGEPLNWTRVAASGDDIYCRPGRRGCRPSDVALRQARCDDQGARRSFDMLLYEARAPCGNLSCSGESAIEYNGCVRWY